MRRSEFPTVRAPLSQVVDRAPTGGEQLRLPTLWRQGPDAAVQAGGASGRGSGRQV